MSGEAKGMSAPATTQGFSLLAACAGFLFASRAIFVLVTARWLNVGTEAGVIAGFVCSMALGGAALFSAVGDRFEPEAWKLRRGPISWITLYQMFSCCSLLWGASASPGTSVLYWAATASDVALVLLLARAFGATCAAHSLMKGYIAGATMLAAIAWVMPRQADLRLGDLDYFNTNQIGNLCALALLMSALLESREDGRRRLASWFLGITLLRSLSKSTLVAFVACQAYRIALDNQMSRRRKWLVVSAAVIITLCCWGLIDAYVDIYTSGPNQVETLTGRTAIWAWTLDAALRRPWFGNGFDAMWNVAPPFGGELFQARHAENEFLQQFYAYGISGVILWAGTYLSLYRRVRRSPRGSQRAILIAMLIYVVVRGLSEAEPFDLLLPMWCIAAVAMLLPHPLGTLDGAADARAPGAISHALPAFLEGL